MSLGICDRVTFCGVDWPLLRRQLPLQFPSTTVDCCCSRPGLFARVVPRTARTVAWVARRQEVLATSGINLATMVNKHWFQCFIFIFGCKL